MADTNDIDISDFSEDELLELIQIGMAVMELSQCDYSVYTNRGKVVVELDARDPTGLKQQFPGDWIGEALMLAAKEGYLEDQS